LSGLRAHDEQIAQLRASLAASLAETQGLSADEKAKAQAKIEDLLAYQAVSKDETERLRASTSRPPRACRRRKPRSPSCARN
ncbi:hypothetical protein, partial [Methyloceanibacter marginalis]|uniref:hypothetical protein n=1 Tax=Methyloceanibacter marginalis TaxID=1774971 RepID=UPI00195C0C9D